MKKYIFILLSVSYTVSYGQSAASLISVADSLFLKQEWSTAQATYQKAFSSGEPQTALSLNRLAYCYLNKGEYANAVDNFKLSLQKNPTQAGERIIRSRLAMAYAGSHDSKMAIEELDSAVTHGYANVPEIDSTKEFDNIRNDAAFKALVSRANDILYPCMKDPHAREFDFWIGEWDVYPTGSNQLVGRSSIQMGSGGCFILENWTAIGYPNTGKSMNFVDPATNKWKQVWVGSGGAVTEYVNGVYKDSAMQFESTSKTPKGVSKIRFRFFNEGPDKVRQFQEYSTDDGKTWNVSYDLTYIRKKA